MELHNIVYIVTNLYKTLAKRSHAKTRKKLNNKDKVFADNDDKLKALANQMANRKFSFRNLENIVKEAKCMYIDDKQKALNSEFKINYIEKRYDLIKLSDGELESKLSATQAKV